MDSPPQIISCPIDPRHIAARREYKFYRDWARDYIYSYACDPHGLLSICKLCGMSVGLFGTFSLFDHFLVERGVDLHMSGSGVWLSFDKYDVSIIDGRIYSLINSIAIHYPQCIFLEVNDERHNSKKFIADIVSDNEFVTLRLCNQSARAFIKYLMNYTFRCKQCGILFETFPTLEIVVKHLCSEECFSYSKRIYKQEFASEKNITSVMKLIRLRQMYI